MASLARDKNGTKRITFRDPGNGKSRTIRLGKAPVKTAEAIKVKVESLVWCKGTGTTPDPELAAWVRTIGDDLHEKLVRVGLVKPRNRQQAAETVAELLDRFVTAKAVKATTRAAYKQTTDSLCEFFGGSKPVRDITAADAEAWRKSIAESTLAPATVAKRTHVAKAIFKAAVRWDLIVSSPFSHLKAGSQSNPDKNRYIPVETIERVIEVAPVQSGRQSSRSADTQACGAPQRSVCFAGVTSTGNTVECWCAHQRPQHTAQSTRFV